MSIYIQAISVGKAVPRTDFGVVVHSVFPSAVNLQPRGERQLLTLLGSNEADLPQGIRLDTKPGFSFGELAVGSKGSCRDGILYLDGVRLAVDLRQAICWDGSLLFSHPDVNDPAVTRAWHCAWKAVNDRQRRYGCQLVAAELAHQTAKERPLWIQQMGETMRSLFRATAQCDLEATRTLESVIGLGPGLTPSGDDLVTGYLIGLWCAAQGNGIRLRFLAGIGEAVVRLSKRTNDISHTYLFHASRGQASSKLVDLALAICTGADNAHVLEVTGEAMRVGHTSGMDAVAGLLFGLAAWDGVHLSRQRADRPMHGSG